jgi:hypothetical protein
MGEPNEKTTFASRLGHNFLTGLFLLLPIGLTLYVVSVLLDLMGTFIQPALEIGLTWLWQNAKQPVPDFAAGLYRQLVVLSSAVVMIFWSSSATSRSGCSARSSTGGSPRRSNASRAWARCMGPSARWSTRSAAATRTPSAAW